MTKWTFFPHVLAHCDDQGIIVIAGDLFEREEDLFNEKLWKDIAGSEAPELQKQHRATVLELADFIIPGHGKMFAVPMKKTTVS